MWSRPLEISEHVYSQLSFVSMTELHMLHTAFIHGTSKEQLHWKITCVKRWTNCHITVMDIRGPRQCRFYWLANHQNKHSHRECAWSSRSWTLLTAGALFYENLATANSASSPSSVYPLILAIIHWSVCSVLGKCNCTTIDLCLFEIRRSRHWAHAYIRGIFLLFVMFLSWFLPFSTHISPLTVHFFSKCQTGERMVP